MDQPPEGVWLLMREDQRRQLTARLSQLLQRYLRAKSQGGDDDAASFGQAGEPQDPQ
jgi:hypothetical protein